MPKPCTRTSACKRSIPACSKWARRIPTAAAVQRFQRESRTHPAPLAPNESKSNTTGAYSGTIPIFAIPLKPEAYRQRTVGRLSITIDAQSAHSIEAFEVTGKSYPLKINEKTANKVRASLDVRNFVLSEDFAISLRRTAQTTALTVAAQREAATEPGYFKTFLVLPRRTGRAAGPRRVTALFDASLSMQWDKLERSYAALAKLLTGLRAEDQFDLFVFNSAITRYGTAPAPGGSAEAKRRWRG